MDRNYHQVYPVTKMCLLQREVLNDEVRQWGERAKEGGGGGFPKSGTYLMCGKSPITSGREREPRLHNSSSILAYNEMLRSRVWPIQRGGCKHITVHQMCKHAHTHTHKFIKWLYYNASAQEQLLHTQTRTVHVNSQHFRVVQTVYCQLAARWKLLAAAGLAGAARLIN